MPRRNSRCCAQTSAALSRGRAWHPYEQQPGLGEARKLGYGTAARGRRPAGRASRGPAQLRPGAAARTQLRSRAGVQSSVGGHVGVDADRVGVDAAGDVGNVDKAWRAARVGVSRVTRVRKWRSRCGRRGSARRPAAARLVRVEAGASGGKASSPLCSRNTLICIDLRGRGGDKACRPQVCNRRRAASGGAATGARPRPAANERRTRARCTNREGRAAAHARAHLTPWWQSTTVGLPMSRSSVIVSDQLRGVTPGGGDGVARGSLAGWGFAGIARAPTSSGGSDQLSHRSPVNSLVPPPPTHTAQHTHSTRIHTAIQRSYPPPSRSHA